MPAKMALMKVNLTVLAAGRKHCPAPDQSIQRVKPYPALENE